MPQNYKTSVNNLIIVWQGSNWSVIAPDGYVIARFMDKNTAYDFASSNLEYASSEYRPFEFEPSHEEKLKIISAPINPDRRVSTLPNNSFTSRFLSYLRLSLRETGKWMVRYLVIWPVYLICYIALVIAFIFGTIQFIIRIFSPTDVNPAFICIFTFVAISVLVILAKSIKKILDDPLV